VAPIKRGLTGRIAAGLCSTEVRSSGGGPVRTGTHLRDTCREMPLRSKPEGCNPAGPGCRTSTYFLLLSKLVLLRVVRCRKVSGQAADDAVLTLIFLNLRAGVAF
jgi:hypothetical protein